jgi:hypothetical protein
MLAQSEVWGMEQKQKFTVLSDSVGAWDEAN